MKIIGTERLPIKMWIENIEDSALEQAKNLANLPFAYKHIALMPDSHCGYGMPIGGILATKDVIIPNAVGVDIGCGMCAIKTTLQEANTELLKKIMGKIREVVPVGFNHQKEKQNDELMPDLDIPAHKIVEREYENALYQLGTLGGGNHFIEIQRDSEGYIWIMLHSGSRNFGFKVANYYNEIAKKINEKWHSSVPKEHDLAFLPIDSDEGQDYISEMNYCVNFAFANRKLMMDRICEIIFDLSPIAIDPMINIAHNYASLEHHFDRDVWVHRKGATLARENTIGIIPGSQGTKSYIVKGKGNPQSFQSCSHGAGRAMGRKEAQRKLNLEEEIKKLDEQNIIHSVRNIKDLDEASGAYKDIQEVMNNQLDLIEIIHELNPLAVIKG